MSAYKFESVVFGHTYACNSEREGLFLKTAQGWKQQTGTLQTPRFFTQKQFAAWVRRRFNALAKAGGFKNYSDMRAFQTRAGL